MMFTYGGMFCGCRNLFNHKKVIPNIDRFRVLIFDEFSERIWFRNYIVIGMYVYIIDFCYFVMCFVCVLPDVYSIVVNTAGILYVILVGAEDIILCATTIIVGTGFIMIPILVVDLFFFDANNIFVLLYQNQYFCTDDRYSD